MAGILAVAVSLLERVNGRPTIVPSRVEKEASADNPRRGGPLAAWPKVVSGSVGGEIMIEHEGEVIIGILGQWASGKSTAARTLVEHLGGEGKVVFLNDQPLLAAQAVNHILQLEDSIVWSIEGDGRQRLEGEHATVWLGPGENLRTVDLNGLQFDVDDDALPAWLDRARVELGYQICERSPEGKPIVMEAGFGKYPSDHTIPDLFIALEEAGVELGRVRWIIVEAGYDKRSERNEKRRFGPPFDVFARYAAQGGDLHPDHQRRLEEQGIMIKRVLNDHDDVGRFRADILAAVETMFKTRIGAGDDGGQGADGLRL